MKKPFSFTALSLAPAIVLSLAVAQPANADGDSSHKLKAKPWVFVGSAEVCAPSPAGTQIVAAGWVDHFGLPDGKGKGDDDDDDGRSKNQALQLSKNGLTTDCSSAGASIKGVKGLTLTELGYDVRDNLHCESGAPRFNVVATDGFHFMGACNNAVVTADTPQAGWSRVRIDPTNPLHAFPPLAAGATIVSIDIVFDEGTDAGPDFTGLAIIDNIDINGKLIGRK